MLLKEICTPHVVCCAPDTSALSVARLMRERHVGDVIVVDDVEGDRSPIGVVTDRDLVVEVLGREIDPAKVTAREIMRMPVVIARASEDALQALERMKAHGVRRIPVVDDSSRLAGIVSLDDLLRHLADVAVGLAEIVAREQDRERRARR